MGGSGWAEIEPVFHRMGASLSACRSYDIEVIAARACDELAYTIAHERGSAFAVSIGKFGLVPWLAEYGPPCRSCRKSGRAG